MQAYSDPTRASDPYSLPDLEVFYCDAGEAYTDDGEESPAGWYWWACFPGCMPDGDPDGPYDSAAEALEAARDFGA